MFSIAINNILISSKLLFLFLAITSAQWNIENFYKKEHSLVKPYQGSGMTIPDWDILGHTIATYDFVRLTADAQSKQGAVWNSVPVMLTSWEIHLQFKIHGKGKDLYGDGIAFWYTKERMQPGPIFGNMDFFSGLVVFLDTYSNHNGPHNHQHPYISAMVNNGTLHYDHDKDGTHTQLAGCEAKFRNVDHDTTVIIRYAKNTLTVMTEFEGSGVRKDCFSISGILLPTGYYLGVSAATGDLSDNHDLIALRMLQIDEIEDERLISERKHILPSATFYEPPRERTEDTAPAGWSGVKTFLVMMLCSICLITLVVLGIMYYQKQQEHSRKRLY